MGWGAAFDSLELDSLNGEDIIIAAYPIMAVEVGDVVDSPDECRAIGTKMKRSKKQGMALSANLKRTCLQKFQGSNTVVI